MHNSTCWIAVTNLFEAAVGKQDKLDKNIVSIKELEIQGHGPLVLVPAEGLGGPLGPLPSGGN